MFERRRYADQEDRREKYLGHACSLIEVERDALERALKRSTTSFHWASQPSDAISECY